jgi:hypothetical protein
VTDVAIVVPTIEGREIDLKRCLRAYKRTAPKAEVIVEHDHGSCGEAWIAGAERTDAEYLHFTADDLEPQPGWLKIAKETVDKGFIPAPLVFNTDGSLDSAGLVGFGQYRGEHQDWQPIEGTTIPFLTREMWETVGMIPVHYCTDLWVSVQGRKHGWETVIRTGMRFTHHVAPAGRNYGRAPDDTREYLRLLEETA